MDFLFGGNSNKGGVYKLTNKLNGRIYIGSTKRFKTRWKQHQKQLEEKTHSNIFLLNDYTKCGSNNFVFEVLDVIESGKEDRLFVEQKYLDYHYDFQNQCYNLTPYSKSREGTNNKNPSPLIGKVVSQETKIKHSIASKQMWQNEEYRKNQSQVQSISKKKSWEDTNFREKVIAGINKPENIQKRSDAMKNNWTLERKEKASQFMKNASHSYKSSCIVLKNPQGELVEINNITDFCKNHPELKRPGLSSVWGGFVSSYKGWTKPI